MECGERSSQWKGVKTGNGEGRKQATTKGENRQRRRAKTGNGEGRKQATAKGENRQQRTAGSLHCGGKIAAFGRDDDFIGEGE
jgi:hypothetical protein